MENNSTNSLEKILLFQDTLLNFLKVELPLLSNKNLLLKGQVGLGQGIASRVLASFTTSGKIIKIQPSSLQFNDGNQVIEYLERLINNNLGSLFFFEEVDELFTFSHDHVILEFLNREINNDGNIFLITGEIGIDKINSINPDFFSKFNYIALKNFTNNQIAEIFLNDLKNNNIDHRLRKSEVIRVLSNMRSTGNLKNARLARLLKDVSLRDVEINRYKYISKLSMERGALPYMKASGDSGLSELDKLIGLDEIKKLVKLWMKNYDIDGRRKELGLRVEGMGQHMVFKGPPGTAKTTVARIISKILAEIGNISSGHLIETTKLDLVGDTSEETTKKVTQLVKKSLGGVLFIDEAYTLSSEPETRDQGKEAIDCLLKLMEDYRDEFVVIVAGYSLEMDQFLSSNPGFRGRFSRILEFPTYSIDELIEILEFMVSERGFKLDHDVIEKFYSDISISYHLPGFSNARWIRDQIETAILKQASRLSLDDSDDDFLTLKAEDFTDQDFKTYQRY